MALSIHITRFYDSLNFLIDPLGPHTYDNHRGHNMEDLFELYDGKTPLFTCKVQTVANMEGLEPGMQFLHTVGEGSFYIKAFVDQRLFYGDIHGLVGAKTLGGEYTDLECVTPTSPLRHLVHDTQKRKEYPDGSKFGPGIKVRSAWSDGCFIMLPDALAKLSFHLRDKGVRPDQLINAELNMEKK